MISIQTEEERVCGSVCRQSMRACQAEKKSQNIDMVRVRKRQRQTYVNKAGREKAEWKPAECWTVDLSPQLLAKSVICSMVESTSGENPHKHKLSEPPTRRQ